MDVAIQIQNLSKKYKIDKAMKFSDRSMRDEIAKFFLRKKIIHEEFWALRDLNLTIHAGETIGLVGANGSGKSTLLKLLSRVAWPTTGEIEITGRVGALLEVGTGFHVELTGRENVFLCGAILGMQKKDVQRHFDEIVAFSGVDEFLDTPVKHYSSGMFLRLAFSVMSHLRSDILIADEVIAVGDQEFQEKSLAKMQEIASQGRTVIFVSHNTGKIRELCSRVLWLEKGKLIADGETELVLDRFESKAALPAGQV